MGSRPCRFLYGTLDGQTLQVDDIYEVWEAPVERRHAPDPHRAPGPIAVEPLARYRRSAKDDTLFVCFEEPPVTSPSGGCYSHPVSGVGRWCDGRVVATVVPTKIHDQYHPSWRACQYHADQCRDRHCVEWDEGQGPR